MSGILSAFIGRVAGVVTDAYFNLVTLLLPGNGTNGAQNNTFLDSSTNNFTITRNGNTTQGTFSPFSQTGWSNHFNGSSRLSVPDDNAYAFSGDFCIEAWINLSSIATESAIFSQWFGGSVAQTAFYFYVNTSGRLVLVTGVGGTQTVITATSTTVNTNQWAHVAACRSGTTVRLFVNGVADSTTGTVSGTINNIAYAPQIGSINDGGSFVNLLNGYISNLRVTNGALYTSNFTPSTTPLTTTVSAGSVILLTCQSNRFIDNSSNAFAITVNGTPSVQAFSPFAPTAAYSAATVGGSGYFDGTGDYLSTPDNAAFDLGTGDFTFECWVYKPNNNDGAFICSAGNGLEIAYVSGSLRIGRFAVAWDVTQLYTIPQNAWTHIAFTKASGRTYIFANGVLLNAGGTANTNAYDTTTTLYVGVAGDTTSRIFNGYMAGVRLIKGQSLATANFTPPTAPVTTSAVGWTGAASSITGTVSLLLNYANAGVVDSTAKNVLETVGNAQISTTQSKFGGSSMYFDGTGDYLSYTAGSPAFNLSTGDWTIEAWVYRNVSGVAHQIISLFNSAGSNSGLSIKINSSNLVQADNGVTGTTAAGTVSANTWVHVAVVRSSGNTQIYVNGTAAGSAITQAPNTAQFFRIGITVNDLDPFNGYIDDLRITRYARYTANFTPPTAAFALQ